MLSVLLPYRDAAATLREAVASVLSEPEVDEVVAVDDGSLDQSAQIARSIRDARIVHLRTAGVGVARALGAALACARGDVIARMDADDVSLPGRFAAELELLATDASLDVVGCRIEPLGGGALGAPAPEQVTPGLRRYIAWQNAIVSAEDHAREVFIESPLCHPTVVMRRETLERVGGFRDAPWAEDYDLWLRMDAAGARMAKVPHVHYLWRRHDAQATFRDPRCSLERLRQARARYLAPRLRSLGKPLCIWGAGPTGKRLARELEKLGQRAELFVDIDPRKIGRTRRGAPVVGKDALPARTHTIVVAVGAEGARDLVRAELVARGLSEGRDFLCAS